MDSYNEDHWKTHTPPSSPIMETTLTTPHPPEHNTVLIPHPHPDKEEEKKEEDTEEGADGRRTRQRTHWSNKREYLLSTLGFTVGTGNLFRFPYLCNKNGGGAFLIPFLLSVMLIGLPLFALEVSIGQFSGRNAQQVWAICPLFKGAGVGMILVSVIIFWYQNNILTWALYYLVSSFHPLLPWSHCEGWWNTPLCRSYGHPKLHSNSSSLLLLNTSVLLEDFDDVTDYSSSMTRPDVNVTAPKVVSAAEEFWLHNVLRISSGLEEPGDVIWPLALAMSVTLLLCFLALVKGIHSSGKVAYVTATAPVVLVTVLLVRGATLPGALDGVIFYLKPDFSTLLQPQVWAEAAVQVFFSLGPGCGGLIVMASYNHFHNNCLRDSVILTLTGEAISLYGGFAIFSVLGYMAHVSGTDIEKVVTSGPGLAFVVYPEAVGLMPLPQLWAVLFFLMVVTLVIDSQMTLVEVILTTLIDYFPRALRPRRPLVTAVFCLLAYVISLPLVTQGGIYIYQLVDWFVASLTNMTVGLLECIVVGWIYGVSRISEDIELMLGRRPPFLLTFLWRFVTPLLLVALLVVTFSNYTPPSYGDYHYSVGGKLFGWCVALVSFVPIPLFAIYQLLFTASGSLRQRLRHTLTPDTKTWTPADVTVRKLYQKHVSNMTEL